MFCKNCGNILNENEKFCSKCGSVVENNNVESEDNIEVLNENVNNEQILNSSTNFNDVNQSLNSNVASNETINISEAINMPNNNMNNVQPDISINNSMNSIQPDTSINNSMNSVQPDTPINNNMNSINSAPKKKKNTLYIVLIVVLSVIIIGLIVFICIYLYNDKKDVTEETESVVEETTSNNNNNGVVDVSTSETLTYGNYEFTLVDGFKYKINEGVLDVIDDEKSMLVSLTIDDCTYEYAKTYADSLNTILINAGYTVNNFSTGIIDGNEYLLYDCSYNGYNLLYFVTNIANTNAIEGILTVATGYTYNDVLSKVNTIILNAKRTGTDSNKFNTFSTSIPKAEDNTFSISLD